MGWLSKGDGFLGGEGIVKNLSLAYIHQSLDRVVRHAKFFVRRLRREIAAG